MTARILAVGMLIALSGSRVVTTAETSSRKTQKADIHKLLASRVTTENYEGQIQGRGANACGEIQVCRWYSRSAPPTGP